MTTLPPGWYDDPHDAKAERYWDGADWTPYRQRKTTAAIPRPGHSAPPTAPAPQTPSAPAPPPHIGQTPSASAPPPFGQTPIASGPPPVGQMPSASPPPPVGQTPPTAAPAAGQMGADGLKMVKSIAARLPAAVWLIFGGLFVAVVGAVFLPFFTVKETIAGSLTSSADVANTGVVKFVVVLLVAGAVWLAWPLLTGTRMPINRLIGLTVVIGLLIAGAGLDALINDVFSSSGSDELFSVAVMPGFGLMLYGAAMFAATVGVVMIWAQRSSTSGPPV